jgi:hypothetical protein
VDPPPQPFIRPVLSELPSGVDKLVDVVVDVEVRECFGGDAPVVEAEVLSTFGGVLGDVPGGVFGCQFAYRGAFMLWVSICSPKRSTSLGLSGISTVSRTCVAAWRIAPASPAASTLI